eukprot:TRINITY_DN10969_c0_g1_i4.p1 TRINITY_DN10969_c0_g1~~TRINITY_DN10969_c0_g1_i4.p1  ORF type:complete len:371 (-),score=78.31 TRINITY_DN10969_c0_g1_i4:189-1301(-)
MKRRANSNRKVQSPLGNGSKDKTYASPANKKLAGERVSCVDSVASIQAGLQTLRSMLSEYTPKTEALSVEAGVYRKEFNDKASQLQTIENDIKGFTESAEKMREEKLVLEKELSMLESDNKEIKGKADKLFGMNAKIIKSNDQAKEIIANQKHEIQKVRQSIEQNKNKEVIISQHIEESTQTLKSHQEAIQVIKVAYEQARARLQEVANRYNTAKEKLSNLENEILNAQGEREDVVELLKGRDWALTELKMNRASSTVKQMLQARSNLESSAETTTRSIGNFKEALNRERCRRTELEAKKRELEAELLKKTIEAERNGHQLIKLKQKYQSLLDNDARLAKDIAKMKENVKASEEENVKVYHLTKGRPRRS